MGKIQTAALIRVCLALLFLLFTISCTGLSTTTNYRFRVPDNNSRMGCITTKTYGYEYRDFGEFREFTAEVHSQVFLKESHLSADEVAELAILVQEEALKEYRLRSWQKELLGEALKNTLVVVLDGEANLLAFWPGTNGIRLWGAMYVKRGICFEMPDGVYYVIAVRNDRFYRSDPSTVVHEMMHLISYIITPEDFDSDHKNPRLWADLSTKSIQARVLDRFQNNMLTRRPQEPFKDSTKVAGVSKGLH